ncbi:MAG: hypothetical protein ACI4XF_04585, partial [Oscillospiraceae bacterium]
MDFNTQRKAVAAVEGFGRKYKIFYPLCMLAVLCIALFCSAVRAVDMALSDDDGHFLGMNRSHKKHKSARKHERTVPVSAEKRGFFRRAVSGLLAACFAVMVVPEGLEIVSFAASSTATESQLRIEDSVLKGFKDTLTGYDYKKTLDVPAGAWTEIGETAFQDVQYISSIDLTGVKHIGAQAFSGARSLTRVIIDGSQFSDADSFKYVEDGDDPFSNISDDAIIYIINSNDKTDTIKKKLPQGFESNHKVIWRSGSSVPNPPTDVSDVEIVGSVKDAPYVYIKVTMSTPSANFLGIKLYGKINSGFKTIKEFDVQKLLDDDALCLKPDDYTYIIRLDASDISGCTSVGARVWNNSKEFSTHYAWSDDNMELLVHTPEAQTLNYNLGGDGGLVPTVNWDCTDRSYVDYYIYTDSDTSESGYSLLKNNSEIRTDSINDNANLTDKYLSTLDEITSVDGYVVYLLEVYDPLGQFTNADRYRLLTSGGTGKWSNDGFFYYRISQTKVVANQLPWVNNISVTRNSNCNNEIIFKWDPVDGENGMKADGYYVYFDNKIVQRVSGYSTNEYIYVLPEDFSSGSHSYNVTAYKEYSALTGEAEPYRQEGKKKAEYYPVSVDSYRLTTESVNENEIVLKWTYPVITNSTNPTGYAKNEDKFIIDYSYALNEEETRSDSINVTASPNSKGEYSYTINTYIGGYFEPGTEYTFTVSQNCPDNTHEHFFTSNEARARSAVKPAVKPVLTIENGNREFSVIAELPDDYVMDQNNPVAGYHMQVFTKNGDQKGDLLHDSYMAADETGYAFERVQTFNESKGSNPASPLNNTEYIVELTPYVHSQHENSTSYADLPSTPYNTSGYKPYPIEGDPDTLVTDVATPTNNLTLRVTWNNSDKPSGRGALLTWNTVNDKAQYYRIIRRRLDGTKEENADIVLEAKYPGKGLGQENTYIDSTAPFAIYTPDPDDPNGDVDYYAKFEYEVEAVYSDGTADPMPATAAFQFKEAYASLSAPTDVKAVGQDGQITVTWISVDAADRYFIYRDDEKTPIIKLESDGKAGNTLTYVDHPMDNSTEHTYSVTAVYSVADNDSNDPNLRKLVESVKVSATGVAGDRFPPVTGLTGSTTD